MTWLLAGIIPPILWAVVNHTDKYLLSKTKYRSSVSVLMVYSTLFSLIVLPFLYFFSRHELFLSSEQIWVQLFGGVLLTFSIYFYLVALNKDETSVVMPFALLVPVFGFIFSYLFLGETLSLKQIISCLLIIAGAAVLSLEFSEERKVRVRHGVLLAMILCTSFQAAQETLFKSVSIQNSFVVSLFWLHVGIALCGLFLILFKKNVFKHFVESIKANGKVIFSVCVVSEAATSIAYMIANYAVLLAPVTIIMTLNGYQPVFVFIIGVATTIFAPKLVNEKVSFFHLFHKGLAIVIILVGTILVAQTI